MRLTHDLDNNGISPWTKESRFDWIRELDAGSPWFLIDFKIPITNYKLVSLLTWDPFHPWVSIYKTHQFGLEIHFRKWIQRIVDLRIHRGQLSLKRVVGSNSFHTDRIRFSSASRKTRSRENKAWVKIRHRRRRQRRTEETREGRSTSKEKAFSVDDIHPFIMHKTASLPKCALKQLNDSILDGTHPHADLLRKKVRFNTYKLW